MVHYANIICNRYGNKAPSKVKLVKYPKNPKQQQDMIASAPIPLKPLKRQIIKSQRKQQHRTTKTP